MKDSSINPNAARGFIEVNPDRRWTEGQTIKWTYVLQDKNGFLVYADGLITSYCWVSLRREGRLFHARISHEKGYWCDQWDRLPHKALFKLLSAEWNTNPFSDTELPLWVRIKHAFGFA